jgi:hypothetical protein
VSNRVSLLVTDRAGVTVASADFLGADGKATWSPGSQYVFQDELDDVGYGSIVVQADAVDVDEVQAGHILVILLDAVPVWRGLIKKLSRQEIGGDESEHTVTIEYVGEVGRLDEAVVYPTGGLGRFPFSDDRAFNWTAPEFIDSAWQPAVETPANYGQTDENYGLPEGFPWGDAEWIWDQDSSGTVPGGVKYMRHATNILNRGVYEAWSAADDRNEVWISGKSVLKSSDAPYDGRTTAVELYMTEDWAQVAARVENRNDLKAGFLFGIGQPKMNEAPYALTSDDWLIAPDGAPLGMTAGYIMDILLDEFVARGGVSPTRTWTSTLDSNGDPWTVYEEVTVQVMTTTYLDVLRQMVELEMCDFRMSPDGYELNLYNAGGAGELVALSLGDTNLTSLTWDSVGAVSSALLVRWDRGYTDTDNAGLVDAHGRRESGLSLAGINAETTAQGQADRVIARLGNDRTEVAAGFDPASTADEPYTAFTPGDSLTVPLPGSMLGWNDGVWNDGNWNESAPGESPQRVLAVGMGIDDVGHPVWDIHLANHIDEMAKRQQVMLKKLAASVGGRSTAGTIPYEPRPITPREPEPIVFSQDGGITVRESGRHTFTRAVRVREVRVDIAPASTSGDVVVVAKKNGTVFATVTIPHGRQESYVTTSTVFDQRADILTVETTSVGVGVESVTVNVVYA